MLRKILAIAALVGLVAVAAPQEAQASTNDGVVVFTGTAKVGKLAWGGAGFGDGLCFPAHTVAPGSCTANPAAPLVQANNTWTFDVPLAGGVSNNIPLTCNAAGVFNGLSAVPTPGANNCSLTTDGIVTANQFNVGPSCGMSRGTSAAGPVDAQGNPTTVDQITVVGVGSATTSLNWLTSAGGSIPIDGTVDYGGHTHPFNGYVQTRPVSGGNCATVPAEDFVTAGVIATR